MASSTEPESGRLQESSLDPADWTEFRALCHQAIDDMINHLASLREQPAWQAMPSEVFESFQKPAPRQPEGAESAYRDFVANVMPYTNGNRHPRFFGWAQGNGTPVGMLADMLAAGINAHLAGFNQAPVQVEHQVLRWFIDLMGMPHDSSGLLVSGGTVANIIGVAVARHKQAGFDVREQGLQRTGHPLLTVYCSAETHSWLVRAAELLGLGRQAIRRIPVSPDYRMDVSVLRQTIDVDRSNGCRPICVVATAGTVNTGAIDNLSELADLCEQEQIWLHVDGASGALARISPRLGQLVAGIERADSIAFDLHKWMYLPFEVACILVRDAEAHRSAFAMSASYLSDSDRGVMAGGLPFAERGLELTRGFKALKVWMSLKAHGVDAFAAMIEQNVEQARYLADLIDKHPELERLAPAPLNIVCFRFAPKGLDDAQLDALNAEILLRVQEDGIAVPSSTIIQGHFAIRVAILNHRSRREDFDLLVSAIVNLGRESYRAFQEH